MSLTRITAAEQRYLSTAETEGITIIRVKGELNGANLDRCYQSCSQGMYEPFVIMVPMKHREFMANLTHWYFRFKGAQIVFSDTIPDQANEIIFHSLAPRYPCVVWTITE